MVKCVIGYDVAEGMTIEEYDRWLWDVHVPDLLANPYLDKLVFNTTIRPVLEMSGRVGTVPASQSYHRIAEMHFEDLETYEQYLKWFEAHPLSEERGPKGRTDFKFYLLCDVAEVSREGRSGALPGVGAR